jgi:hypothetical protein
LGAAHTHPTHHLTRNTMNSWPLSDRMLELNPVEPVGVVAGGAGGGGQVGRCGNVSAERVKRNGVRGERPRRTACRGEELGCCCASLHM